MLNTPIIADEIEKVLKSLPSGKVPGLGFTYLYYQTFKDHLFSPYLFVQYFFNGGSNSANHAPLLHLVNSKT